MATCQLISKILSRFSMVRKDRVFLDFKRQHGGGNKGAGSQICLDLNPPVLTYWYMFLGKSLPQGEPQLLQPKNGSSISLIVLWWKLNGIMLRMESAQ